MSNLKIPKKTKHQKHIDLIEYYYSTNPSKKQSEKKSAEKRSNPNKSNSKAQMRINGNDKPFGTSISFAMLSRPQTAKVEAALPKGSKISETLCNEHCVCGKHHSPNKEMKYRYPKNMGSFYQKEFTKVNIPIPTEVYIHEKHKNHRNSHKMDCTTQNQVTYKSPAKEAYVQGRKKMANTKPERFSGASSYASAFPNWCATNHNIEKTPQYPVYSLPFNSTTSYTENFKKSGQKAMVSPKNRDHQVFYNDLPFETKSNAMSEFTPGKGDRYPAYKPDREPTRTFEFPGQFESTASREFVKKQDMDYCNARRSMTAFYEIKQPYFDPSASKITFK